jgi:hypothetical protein
MDHIRGNCPCIVLYQNFKFSTGNNEVYSDIGYFTSEDDNFGDLTSEKYIERIKVLEYEKNFEGIINE